MLRFGPADGPTLLFAPALFEEANRTRTAMIDVGRRLAADGFGVALPDLPGTGESLAPTVEARLTSWRRAFAACAETLPSPVHLVAWRGGALVATEAAVASRWCLAPLSGAAVTRDLHRIRAASGLAAAAGDASEYGGNLLHRALLDELDAAEPVTAPPLRVVRLASDPRPADAKLDGVALWRRTEPATDARLQAAIASDIAAWVRTCAG